MLVRTYPAKQHGTLVSRALPTAQQVGGDDVSVVSCTMQFNAVCPGDAFVLDPNERDAHATAQGAVARGAAAIVTDRFLPVFGIPQYVVDDTAAAYSELCHAILGHPAQEINAIAIAGAHGKTSIAMVLDFHFLRSRKKRCHPRAINLHVSMATGLGSFCQPRRRRLQNLSTKASPRAAARRSSS